MTESYIFFSYTGLIDFKKIDILLLQLKKTKEFRNLNKTTCKRVYSVIVECLENIVNHSVTDQNADYRFQSFISAEEQENKVIVKAGNLVHTDKKKKVVCCINMLNKLNDEELRVLHEKTLGNGLIEAQNGAGLGYIIMKMRSGNKIRYSFSRIDNNLSFFEIQISITKYHEKVND